MLIRMLPAWMLGLCLCCAEGTLPAKPPAPGDRSLFSNTRADETDISAADDEESGESDEEEEEDEIETDRDSFTPATTTAGANRLILESAYSFLDNRHTFETHSFPEFIARRGVTDWFEFRLGWNYEIGGEGNTVSGVGLGGEFEGAKLVVAAHNFVWSEGRPQPAEWLDPQKCADRSGVHAHRWLRIP